MSAEKVRAAIAATTDTYVKVTAGVLRDACREVGSSGLGDPAFVLGTHASAICNGGLGNHGPDTVMQIHRDAHGKLFALKTVATPTLET